MSDTNDDEEKRNLDPGKNDAMTIDDDDEDNDDDDCEDRNDSEDDDDDKDKALEGWEEGRLAPLYTRN